MKRLNYKHLQYFHAVAEEGSVLAAARRLNVTPQTISGQLCLLEDELGNQLFAKAGRGLELTDAGRVALDYTREMFRLGDELQEVMHQETTERPLEFRVGIVDALPKSIAHRLLSPALAGPAGEIPEEEQFEELIDIDRVEGRVKASSIEKIGEIVDRNPDGALNIVRDWMYQES